ncbi:bifunctional methylenetetrahydrofolate dehydrogenase/methenyltetrahydrofolate cyclohydrolase FolD [Celeribacter halophilus]|jgi:methylenetetrahydrofolate dehydrogenase (NADP+)/methenyltetrahydrofolate cyclohydrolase|uniref:Bifunctional protein FolD n=1 Tax=Celeribacter halophilus TaxID=576117 RepID=A0A1I3QWY1_9RHOB|nr:bifunctional methylenetetrahydrofolate dehydrogenase/methenyltetrahydrofolate cyclohydrolase FolD [Celeribacter halophilus]MBU2890328.1 bifunctional methylenetetrahydrofolate dehydrogenase/methenyltetrahydrofolate cyclohydrolase FolD [Celeribacter halophilus]MDO6456115.1 bifunctional methylenetetrahydrofolate dehydrogenase/methenyltetrahydrofolate cyclohydrolase FolD [Celeribacter halophilus]MDO6511715.1 bifunctional methylenetetrahydrofolate dehydrogenase/methenyltetrahydrofolate cyclohydrol
MTAQIIDGKALAADLRSSVKDVVAQIKAEHGVIPGLAVVLVGNDPASEVYVRSKGKQTVEAGMNSFEYRLSEDTSEEELLNLITRLNSDPEVHGILVQLPLPAHLDSKLVINAIDPHKDVDGFHTTNVGMVGTGQDAIVPCTPRGCMMMLAQIYPDLRGKTALVIGHSNIVGKPMGRLLLNADCTVIVAHKSSTNIPELARMADIVVVAAGVPGLVKAEWIKPGATVIDVGINRIPAPERGEGKTRLVGDVCFDEVSEVAGAITPVPGGVGPMTIACLLANTLSACCHLHSFPEPTLLGV